MKTGAKTGPKKGKPAKWRPIYLVTVYRMRRAGLTDVEVAKELGLGSKQTLYNWRRALPELREAERLAAEELARDSETLADWVYERLPDELREVWKKLTDLNEQKAGVAAVEALLFDHGKGVRQRLFLHALCEHNFDPSTALKTVNAKKSDLDRWAAEDPGFADLVREISWHKANFFDGHLVKLVREGNPAAVVFANRTANAARGYGNAGTVRHEHTGVVGVAAAAPALDLADLAPHLSDSARGELLLALRKVTEQRLRGPATAQELLYREIAGEPRGGVSGPGVSSP